MRYETLCLHGGIQPDSVNHSMGVPVHRTSAYLFRDTEHAANLFALKELGNIYTRLGNPTQDVLEKRLAQIEGGAAALAVASGTSAIFYSIVNLAKAGDEIVSANNLYGGTYTQFNDILPALGIKVVFVDPSDPANFERAITPRTRAIFCEVLANPSLFITDLEAVARIAHAHGLPVIVDATTTPPGLMRCLDHGADIVVHSLTKWIGGHGTGIGGAVIDSGRFDWTAGRHPLYTEPDESYHGLRWAVDLPEPLRPLAYILRMRTVPLRNLGACISPDNAWMFLQGLETLPLRLERHCTNALAVARHLASHPAVDWVRHPGLPGDRSSAMNAKYLGGRGGAMVVFGIKGGSAGGARFIDNLKLFSHVANMGDAKSLAVHPASTTHSQLTPGQLVAGGIGPELIRLCVGIEHIDDIIEDLDQALAIAVAK